MSVKNSGGIRSNLKVDGEKLGHFMPCLIASAVIKPHWIALLSAQPGCLMTPSNSHASAHDGTDLRLPYGTAAEVVTTSLWEETGCVQSKQRPLTSWARTLVGVAAPGSSIDPTPRPRPGAVPLPPSSDGRRLPLLPAWAWRAGVTAATRLLGR